MAEMNCGPVGMVVAEPSPEPGIQDGFKSPADRHDKDHENSSDLVQTAVMMMELLRPLPSLSLQPQSAESARSLLAKDDKTTIGRDEAHRRVQDRFVSESKGNEVDAVRTGVMSATASLVSGQEKQAGCRQAGPVNADYYGELSLKLPDAETSTVTVGRHAATAHKTLDDSTREAAPGLLVPQHVRQEQSAMLAEKMGGMDMHRSQEFLADIGNHDNAHANGWTYQFKTWGQEHAVNISLSQGASAADALLSLRPTSHLVEQRLHSHVGDLAGTGQWVLHEHKGDQGKHQGDPHRDEAEEDEQ